MTLSLARSSAKDRTRRCADCLFLPGAAFSHSATAQVVHAVYVATEQEYAIKILDKGHLAKVQKMQTALAEKNTLVRLGSGHPGIVRLHWTFQDEWSLCMHGVSIIMSFTF